MSKYTPSKGARKEQQQRIKKIIEHDNREGREALSQKFKFSPEMKLDSYAGMSLISLLLLASVVGPSRATLSQGETNNRDGGTDTESSSNTLSWIGGNNSTASATTTNATSLSSAPFINPMVSPSSLKTFPSACSVEEILKVAKQEKTEPFMGKFGRNFPHAGTVTLSGGRNNYEPTTENVYDLYLKLSEKGKITADTSEDQAFTIIQQYLSSKVYRSFSIDSITQNSDPKDRERFEKTCDYVNQAVIEKSNFPENEAEWVSLSNKLNSYLRGKSNNSKDNYRNQDVIIKKVSPFVPGFSSIKRMTKYIKEYGTNEDLSNYKALLTILKNTGIENTKSNENNVVFDLLGSNKESQAKAFVSKFYVINTLKKAEIENKVVALFKILTQELKQIEQAPETPKANKEVIIGKYIEIAAMVHNEFVKIHPFEDSNGRTARLLVNIILKKSGLIPLFIPITDADYHTAVVMDYEEGSTKHFSQYLLQTICKLTNLKSHPDFTPDMAEQTIATCGDGEDCGKLLHDKIGEMIGDQVAIPTDQTAVLNGEIGIY